MLIARFLLALSTAITAFIVITPLNNFYLIIPLVIVVVAVAVDNNLKKPMSRGKIGEIAIAGFIGMSTIWVAASLQPEIWIVILLSGGIGIGAWGVLARIPNSP